MEVKMDNRVALITGGSKGLGLAMATRFAQSGARVVIAARDEETLANAEAALLKAAPESAVRAISADVSNPQSVRDLYEGAVAAFGQVDILVNNAGQSATGQFEDITDEVWQSDLDLKLFAAIRLARLAFPDMKKRRWGRIINVLNTHAKAPTAGSAPTSVSRAAGMALTKVLASEGAPHNVLVNALCTGLIESDQWVRRHAAQGEGSYQDFLANMGKGVPMGRVGESVEFANMACFLASDAGSYITGTAINVDGNRCPVV